MEEKEKRKMESAIFEYEWWKRKSDNEICEFLIKI